MPSLEQLEKFFGVLLPTACREHVLGDLHERATSPGKFIIDALSVLGPVVISRIRRTTDFQVLLVETFALYLSFSAAAWCLGQKAFLYNHAGFARIAIPTTVTVATLLLCNAYADSEKRSWMTPLLQSVGSISLAFLGQALVFDARSSLAVPFGIMLYGSCAGILLIAGLRVVFPPVDSPLRFALLNELRSRQDPSLVFAKAPFQQIRRRMSRVQPAPGFKIASACGVAFLILAVFVLGFPSWHAFFVIVVLAIIYKLRSRQ